MASLSSRWCAVASRSFAARPPVVSPPSSTTRWYASMPSRNKLARDLERAARQNSAKMTSKPTMSQMQKVSNVEYFQDGGPLFPGTFVALPLSQCPRSLRPFAQYQWLRLKHWLMGAVSVLNFKLRSMPNWTTRPRWKARRGTIAPTAKVMYREVLEAFAAADKATLHRICLGNFARRLCAAIDRRDPGHGVRFQLLQYNKPYFYPRLLSHQIHRVNPFDKVFMTEQAVVAIASTQEASRFNAATGETLPGSLKLQDKIEYVVLSRQANTKTFETTPWRIWGTTSATTLDAHLEEMAVLEKEQARRAGFDASATKH